MFICDQGIVILGTQIWAETQKCPNTEEGKGFYKKKKRIITQKERIPIGPDKLGQSLAIND